jgi:AmmeMemoRadiSam system protein A
MTDLNQDDRRKLLRVARTAIEAALNPDTRLERPPVPTGALKEKRGCFVTLHKKGDLRGCIGLIEPSKSLIDGVEENARHAAFDDPRFAPLGLDECPDVDIEISVLTVPRTLVFRDSQELLQQLMTGRHGVILSHGVHRATFLPQVWEQLSDPKSFLTHLCLKAGLSGECWKDGQTRIEIYEAEYFSESGPPSKHP